LNAQTATAAATKTTTKTATAQANAARANAARARSFRTHRWVRQIHLWIGAWGAVAAILFGVTGFLQNHRAVWKLPQGESTEVSRVELPVPESARISREVMRDWLRSTQHLDVESGRGPPGRGAPPGAAPPPPGRGMPVVLPAE